MNHEKVFEFHSPASVQEAIELLGKYGSEAKILAGGTDVIPKLKAKVWNPAHIISLKKIDELHYIEFDKEEGLKIGANTPIREVECNPLVKEMFPALYEGIHAIASTQIRNFATIVGNIVNAVPSADSAPGLIVLGAEVKTISIRGERRFLVEDLFAGVCRTILEPDELITEIIVPVKKPQERSMYYAFTIRRALDLAIAGVAANGYVEGGKFAEIKLALGAVAIKPKRAEHAESYLKDKEVSETVIKEAARIASQEDCAPITDMRATEEYRREIIRVFTENAIKHVAQMSTDIDMSIEELVK